MLEAPTKTPTPINKKKPKGEVNGKTQEKMSLRTEQKNRPLSEAQETKEIIISFLFLSNESFIYSAVDF